MNAPPNGTAHALANGGACAMRPTSVHAKGREGKGRDQTTPHQKLDRSPSSFIVTSVTRATATDE